MFLKCPISSGRQFARGLGYIFREEKTTEISIMGLKEKILDKAVEMFNARGIASTSQNQIAAALEISTGNLTYHYKTKAILIKAVYQRMHADSKDLLVFEGYLSLNDFRKSMGKFQEFQEKYSFFFHDLVFITRKYPEVGKLIEEANLIRFRQGKELFEHYVETGRMVPESKGIDYDCLTHNIWMMSTFWDIQNKIIPATSVLKSPLGMLEMAWYMILPYLTKQGRDEYNQINAFVERQSKGS